jgi:all-trans-retinol 13,14-reductase
MNTTEKKVIVIGSGISGLTVAYHLLKQGYSVKILEQHYEPGGFTHTFKRRNFVWDVGVHYIGQVGSDKYLSRRIFDAMSGGKLQWAELGHQIDRLVFPDRSYDIVKGREAWLETMTTAFPEDEYGLKRLLADLKTIARSTGSFFMEKALPLPAAWTAGPFLRRKFLKFSNMTTKYALNQYTGNPRLHGVLTGQYGDFGLPPAESSFAMTAMIINHYLNGAFYPVGGSKQIAVSILEEIQKLGGIIQTRAKVKNIQVQENKVNGVTLEKGEFIPADIVISSAGVMNTFGPMLSDELPQKYKLQKKRKLVKASAAHLCLHLGLDQSAEKLQLPKTNHWIFPQYDHDAANTRFLKDINAPFPVVFISFPSAKDPIWAEYHGETATIEAISVAPFEWFEKWQDQKIMQRDEEYQELKEMLQERLLQSVTDLFPQIKDHIVHAETSSPLSTKHYTNYQRGEIYGLDHSPQRFRQRWLRPKTTIPGLWLTGQDIVTDGIAGAMMSGILTAAAITGTNILKEYKN